MLSVACDKTILFFYSLPAFIAQIFCGAEWSLLNWRPTCACKLAITRYYQPLNSCCVRNVDREILSVRRIYIY